jgi:hypothetical protein
MSVLRGGSYGRGMSSTEEGTRRPRHARIAKLSSDELARISGQHLTELADHQRRAVIQAHARRLPRSRFLWRTLALGLLSVRETFADAWRWVVNPRRLVGRRWARLKLLSPRKTFGVWKLLLLGAAIGMGFLRFVVWGDEGASDLGRTISGTLFAGFLVGLLASLWNDLIRLPYLGWRIRRRVMRRPECVLRSNLLERKAGRTIPQRRLTIVPRNELYDEVLPGVFARDRKDVQIVVGDPGAGKTTALLGLAYVLARTGVVPVLVPLRAASGHDLLEQAKHRFKDQVDAIARSEGEAELLWRWLLVRRRMAVMVDDADQIAPDGERGLVLRQTLERATAFGAPVIVTARPAGVPAGIAASAIQLASLTDDEAIETVLAGVRDDPSFGAAALPSRRLIQDWVTAGRLAEVPFYLELLAQLAAVGACPKLSAADAVWSVSSGRGRIRRSPDGAYVWNEQWVRFQLLEHYYEQTQRGLVRRSLGIEQQERRSALRALEGAALGTLAATSLDARLTLKPRVGVEAGERGAMPLRTKIREFVDTNDRADAAQESGDPERERRRSQVSAFEVLDAAERLGILDRDADDEPQFRHRIMQAYLASRCLVRRECKLAQAGVGEPERENPLERPAQGERDWLGVLLDHHHPEKLTAHMALTFAALRANAIATARREQGESARPWERLSERIIERLHRGAKDMKRGTGLDAHADGSSHPQTIVTLRSDEGDRSVLLSVALLPEEPAQARAARGDDEELLDPLLTVDPENRVDPDDALMKLTTAADIACAIAADDTTIARIAVEVDGTRGATRWTKLNAIRALEALDPPQAAANDQRWNRIWEFARDRDYEVRWAAASALQRNAYDAFLALVKDIEDLIARAAARSAFGRWLTRPEQGRDGDGASPGRLREELAEAISALIAPGDGLRFHDITRWRSAEDIRALEALGWVLPAIVTGFREDPSAERETSWQGRGANESGKPAPDPYGDAVSCHPSISRHDRVDLARRARQALESLVALAFEGGHANLEAAVAQGFKADAMRHARGGVRGIVGPGWVSTNRELAGGVALGNARFWYARMALFQALALYAIAGANVQETLDTFARLLQPDGLDRHPFTQRAARLARAGLNRHQLGSARWEAFLWDDEGQTVSRRAPQLCHAAAQLAADVTVLLNLYDGSAEDRRDGFALMRELPFCLSRSHDRSEVLGTGCPATCGWGLCPYKQPPPDEPNAHRGVSRAFCRQQREIAAHRRPRWQRAIRKGRLREFWSEMEQRSRM